MFDDVLRKTKKISLRLDKLDLEDFEKLEVLLGQFKGDTDVRLVMSIDGKEIEIFPQEPKQVQISDDFFEGIHQLFGRTDFIEVQN